MASYCFALQQKSFPTKLRNEKSAGEWLAVVSVNFVFITHVLHSFEKFSFTEQLLNILAFACCPLSVLRCFYCTLLKLAEVAKTHFSMCFLQVSFRFGCFTALLWDEWVQASSFIAGEALVEKKRKKDENIGQTKLMFSLPNLIYGKVGIFFWSVFREKLQWLMNYCVSNVSKNLFYRSQRITWHCWYSGQQHVVRTATAGIKEAICESPSFLKHRS